MLGKGFAWIGGSYKQVKLDQCGGYSDNFDYLTIYLFEGSEGMSGATEIGPSLAYHVGPRRPSLEEASHLHHQLAQSPTYG